MKTNLAKLAYGLALLGAAATAPAQSTMNINLSDDGSGNTAISWTVSGDLVSGGATAGTYISGAGGVVAYFESFSSGSLIGPGGGTSLTLIPVSGGGTLTDLSNGNSRQITGVRFGYNGVGLMFDSQLLINAGAGDILQYTAGTDSYVVAMPYSSFTEGNYQYVNYSFLSQPLTFNLTVGAVPEPTTLALVAMGGLSMLLYRRRK